MIVRAGVAMALVLALAGCRSDFAAMKLGGPGYGSVAQAHERQDRYGIDRLPEKTMSDRMLAGARERVTGLKPDPSRFLDSP